ncbi:hypothetical protein [Streptomyces mirabilis]|uniref:Ubiquitin-like domain-containing protein n=1 Tax=Streptomyces mirabilis TaxID=68239 RepID=A0A1I2QL47_9ACTN|nr:hypothetical protein [Streptomyces mirabilis]SFG26947.1 hypothetical protein SAMN02787118_11816 [Streptomyces mirabilis]
MTEHVTTPEQAGAGPQHGQLTVTVYAPRDPDPKTFHFPRAETVGAAATEAAQQFGYTGGTPSFQNSKGEVLNRDLSLVAAHVHKGDTLELVDVGGGV